MASVEGSAISLSVIGTTKIMNIDGSAVSMAGVAKTLVMPIKSTDESSMFVSHLSGIHQVVYNPVDVVVYNKIKPSVYIPLMDSIKTVTSNSYADKELGSKTAQVIDINDTNKYIVGLSMLQENSIKGKTTVRVADTFRNKIIIMDAKIKKCVLNRGKTTRFAPVSNRQFSVTVTDIPSGRNVLNPAYVYVADRTKKSTSGALIKPVSANVSDYRPPTGGATGGSGGIKLIKISAQLHSYFENSLYFNEGNVVSVTGLPQGVFYESGSIKGSPTLSGNYNITIKLDNKVSIPGVIIIPQLPRQF